MKKRIFGCLLALSLCLSMTGCKIGSTDYMLDVTHVDHHSVFQINSEKCEIDEAKLYLCNYKNLYGTSYGVDLWNYDFGDASLSEYVKAVTLSELTRIYCMDLLAVEQEISLSSDEEDRCARAADEYYETLTSDEKNFIGLSKAKLTEYYKHYALAHKLYSILTEGANEEVSDDEARVLRVLQIWVKDATSATEVEEKLNAGEDFASVASSYNQASSIELTVARGQMPKPVEEVIFEMENDAISSKISSEEGYYFIKCLSKYEEDLTQENKVKIQLKREKEQFNDVYDKFLEQATKGLNEQLWNETEIDLDLDIQTDSFFAVYDKYFPEQEIK